MADADQKQIILQRIREKHPDRIPVIVEKMKDSKLPSPANSR